MSSLTSASTKIFRGLAVSLLLLVLLFGQLHGQAAAAAANQCPTGMSTIDCEALLGNWPVYVPDVCGQSGDSTGGATNVSTTDTEKANAEIIIGVTKSENLGQNAATVALMVGLAESHLTDLANSNVPVSLTNPAKQGVGSDHDSVGVFQQRPSTGWSTIATGDAADSNKNAVWQLMNAAYSAEAFLGSPAGSNAPSALSKGLQDVSGWQSLDPGVAAQRVQGSASSDGSAYDVFESQAQSLVSQLWGTTNAVALPIALNGSGNPNANENPNCDSSTISCTGGTAGATSGVSQTRQNIVCIAEKELATWKSQPGYGKEYPGFPYAANGYLKYSENRPEEWCADFASWVYNQAGDALQSPNWNISYVPNIQAVGQNGGKFSWHPAGSGYTPQPGDLAIHGANHVNIFISSSNGTSQYIGGDQGDGPYPGGSIVSLVTSPGYYGDDGSGPITGYVSPN